VRELQRAYEALLFPDSAIATVTSLAILGVVKYDNNRRLRPKKGLWGARVPLRVLSRGPRGGSRLRTAVIAVDGLHRRRVGAQVTRRPLKRLNGAKP